MTCQVCQHENRESAKFCDNCGGRLPRRCPSCGTVARATARFCDECGCDLGASMPAAPPAPAAVRVADVAGRLAEKLPGYTPRHLADKILTSRSALEGERKQVTVLFADCVGFTQLSTRVDPEELHRIMDGCFQHLLEAVHRYEGTVNQFTGDGIMALFGAPIAHEDHAVRAVAAALAVQARLRDYAERLREGSGIDFAVRIGINTGPVVVGKIGDDLRMDYTAQGETVNLAARLQAEAPAGGIVVSEATHHLVGGYFDMRDEGERSLKGVARPVRAFSVAGQRRRRGRFDLAVERGLTPFVGRARDLALLRDGWTRAAAGRGQVVSIVGEAGVGKSRLAYELRRSLDGTQMTYVESRCLPHTAPPFNVIVGFLEHDFDVHDGEEERVQIEKVEHGVRRVDPSLAWTIPYVKHLLALPAAELEAEGLDQVQRKHRLIEAVRALVLRGAQRRPLLLMAEDLQWIDPSSEEFLRAMIDAVAANPILLVCTYRSGYTPTWHGRSYHHRVALEPLGVEETSAMVRALADADGLDQPLGDLIVARAEGNPFFIEELTRYLREGGSAREVPATVQDLLTARIDRLPEPHKRTLQIASVLGRDFSFALLEAVAPVPDLKDVLAQLVSQELLREKDVFPEATYSFSHLLVQQVAYQGLLIKSRSEIHARAAAALEAMHGDRREDVLEALADHYARSPERAKAVHYLTLAGDRAARLFAYGEAEVRYARALEALPAGADAIAARAGILAKMGDTALARGALGEALARWGEALTFVSSDRRRVADLHRRIAGACWEAGRKEDALAHLQAGLAALGDDTENLASASLYQELGRIHFRLGHHEAATGWARRALALGEQLGAHDVASHAYNTLGLALAREGDIEQGAEFVRKSLETALAHQLGAVACRAYTNLAVMHASLDHQRSEDYCREGLALAEKIGDQLQQAWLYCTLAGGHCTIAGDYDEGVKAAEAAAELDERLGQRNHLPVPLIILAQIHQCRGDYERSGHYYRRALAEAAAVGEPQLLFPCYEGLATLAVETGDEAQAEGWLAQSRQLQEATGWTSDTFLVLPFLC